MKLVRIAFCVVFGLAGLSLASCDKVMYAPQYQQGTISHVVVITLKNHGSEADRKTIIDASRELRKIRGVYDVEVGTVLPSSRPIVVSDFDVALVVIFRDEASMQAYVTDPRHVKLQKEVLEPLVAPNGIKVYDFVNHE